ncbi:MAG: cytidine deaminase [Pirellulaceae bacterium]|nr:MAG: cytidine deaminase [Pirellulaceae bacterium]
MGESGANQNRRFPDWQALFEAARDARHRAYAPYSGYRVGAALAGSDGKIYSGCNVENVSYGLTLCAERVAMASAVAGGERRWERLLVLTADAAVPCGACLQVLAEFCQDLPIALANESGIVRLTALSQLLPQAFASGMAQGSHREPHQPD